MAMKTSRILVVDNDPTITTPLKACLEASELYDVRIENDPEKALSAAKEFQPALVLLDIDMPKMVGGDVARSFSQNSSTKNIPIIFLSGMASQDEVDAAGGKISGYPFIPKPIDLPKLIVAIQKHLRK